MALLRYTATFDPFLSLDSPPPLQPRAIQGKEGIKLCHLATWVSQATQEGWKEGREEQELVCSGKVKAASEREVGGANELWSEARPHNNGVRPSSRLSVETRERRQQGRKVTGEKARIPARMERRRMS